MMYTYLISHIKKNIYNYPTLFMVYWWGKDLYLNNELIKISDVELMNAEYCS